MTSYIWRNTDGDEHATTKIGTRTAAGADVIEFSASNTSLGKHLHQTEFDMVVAIGDNEKPQGDINELQDVGMDSATWVITGSIENPTNNSVQQLVKIWMFDGKTDAVFTKGRFGVEMDDMTSYNCNPTGTGAATEQPRGYILSNWKWIKDGETNGKASFIATLRFNGDPGTLGNNFSWTVNH